MEEKNKAIIGCILFLLFILIIGVGGYIYTFKNDNHKTVNNKENTLANVYKKDATKDYIYYEDENIISEELNLIYKNPVINLDNSQADAIYNELAKENENYANNVKKISQTTNDTGQEIAYNTDDIYSATIREYEDYEYASYVSLVVSDSLYDCFKGVYDYTSIKSYIFDTFKNQRVSNIDILSNYDITLADVKEQIKERLENEITDENTINIDETIENLSNDNSYGLYIDNDGSLGIIFIVKSEQMNYNETMIIS
jgi:hypothetical protein